MSDFNYSDWSIKCFSQCYSTWDADISQDVNGKEYVPDYTYTETGFGYSDEEVGAPSVNIKVPGIDESVIVSSDTDYPRDYYPPEYKVPP